MTSPLHPLITLGTWVADFGDPSGEGANAYYHAGRVYLTGGVRLGASPGPGDEGVDLVRLPDERFYPASDVALTIPFICTAAVTNDGSGMTGIAPVMGKTLFPDLPTHLEATLSADTGILRLNSAPPGPWWPSGSFQYAIHAAVSFNVGATIDPTITISLPPLALGNLSWPARDTPAGDEYQLAPLNPFQLFELTDDASSFALHDTRLHLGGAWIAGTPSADSPDVTAAALVTTDTSVTTGRRPDGSPIVIMREQLESALVDRIATPRPRGDARPYVYPICPFLAGWTGTSPFWQTFVSGEGEKTAFLPDFITTKMLLTTAQFDPAGGAFTTYVELFRAQYGVNPLKVYEYAPGHTITIWAPDLAYDWGQGPRLLSDLLDPSYGVSGGIHVNEEIVIPEWFLVFVNSSGTVANGVMPDGLPPNLQDVPPQWEVLPQNGTAVGASAIGVSNSYLVAPFTYDIRIDNLVHEVPLFDGPPIDYLPDGLSPTALIEKLAGRHQSTTTSVPADLRPFLWRVDQLDQELQVFSSLSYDQAQELIIRVPALFGFDPPDWEAKYAIMLMPFYEAAEGLLAAGDIIDLTDAGFPGEDTIPPGHMSPGPAAAGLVPGPEQTEGMQPGAVTASAPTKTGTGSIEPVVVITGQGTTTLQTDGSATFSQDVPVGTFIVVAIGDRWQESDLGTLTDDAGNTYWPDAMIGAFVYTSSPAGTIPPGYDAPRDGSDFSWSNNTSPSYPIVFHTITTEPITAGQALHMATWVQGGAAVVATAFPGLDVAGLDLANPTWGNAHDGWIAGGYSSAGSLAMIFATGNGGGPLDTTAGDWNVWYNDAPTPSVDSSLMCAWQVAADDSLKTIGGSDVGFLAGVAVSYRLGSTRPPVGTPAVVLSGQTDWLDSAYYEFTFDSDVPVGTLLSIVIGDGLGWGNALALVKDAPGNSYGLEMSGWGPWDYAIALDDRGGSIHLAHCLVDHAISAGDALTVMFDSSFGGGTNQGFCIRGITLGDAAAVSGLGAGVGLRATGGDAHLNAVLDCPAHSIAVGYACYCANDMAQDPGNGWTSLIDPVPLNLNEFRGSERNYLAVAFQAVSAAASLTYDPSSTTCEFGAGVVVAYTGSTGGGVAPPLGPGAIQGSVAAAGLVPVRARRPR